MARPHDAVSAANCGPGGNTWACATVDPGGELLYPGMSIGLALRPSGHTPGEPCSDRSIELWW